jgi:SH3 domain-containing YSC84-like protein 1
MTVPFFRLRLSAAAAAILCLAGAFGPGASAQERKPAPVQAPMSEQQQLVQKAHLTIEAMKTDPSFGNAPNLLRRARAILIVPNLIKGGFFFGAEGGQGVMLAREGTSWSYPAFYTIASGSFGLQIGLEQAQLVLLALSQKAFEGLLQDHFKLGAQAGLTVIVIGSNVQGATTPNLDADLVVWAKSQGAYGGLTLEGSVITANEGDDKAYYGRPVSSREILQQKLVKNPGADPLRHALRTTG